MHYIESHLLPVTAKYCKANSVDDLSVGKNREMENFSDLFQNLIEASRKHEQYRDKECINMIASEGLKSPSSQPDALLLT